MVEPLSTHIIPDYDHNFKVLIVLILFYGFIFPPQYVSNRDCEPEDGLNRSKHVVLLCLDGFRLDFCFIWYFDLI